MSKIIKIKLTGLRSKRWMSELSQCCLLYNVGRGGECVLHSFREVVQYQLFY